MMIESSLSHIEGRDSAGLLQPPIACRLVSDLSRTIGLHGDTIAIELSAADWPADAPAGWDLAQPMRYTAGHTGQSITLDGYRLQRAIDVQRGGSQAESVPGGAPQTHSASIVRLELVTLPGYWRDGRGGTLIEGTFNYLKDDGTVDDAHAAYKTNSELVSIAISAMGFVPGVLPVTLDDFDPPGPLDWNNKPAMLELEALLASTGHRAVFSNDGASIAIIKLASGSDDVVIPAPFDAAAEPYDLYSAPSLRGDVVLVTSGTTRSTIATSRSLASASELRWVWFDQATQRWLDDSETASLYPGTIQPGDINAYKAGPGIGQAKQAEYARLFRAVRFGSGDIDNIKRIVSLRKPVMFAGEEISGTAAVVRASVTRPIAGGVQFINDPISGGSIRIDGARVSPEHGVVILPKNVEFVRQSPGPHGGRGSAVALIGSQLTVSFAHMSETEDFSVDFFVAGWRVDTAGPSPVLTQLTQLEIDAAIVDPNTLRLEAPFLKRVQTFDDATSTYTPLNDVELTAIAQKIADAHIAATLSKSGVIELKGWLNIEPGAFGGAVSQVRWLPDDFRTVISINQHEVPGSFIDQLELQSGRSFASGLGRHRSPGSVVDRRVARSVVPRTESDGPSKPERGAEASEPPRVQDTPAEPPGQIMQSILAKITGNLSQGTNIWHYQWEQVAITASGIFDTVSGGMTHDTDGLAINPCEASNTGTGVEGNGVDRNNLPAGFSMQPIAIGCVVRLDGPFDDGDSTAFWLMIGGPTNSDDGTCEPKKAPPQ